ncbi:MAG: hypothetical protein ACREE7_17690 [Dongiaceae bacterium]
MACEGRTLAFPDAGDPADEATFDLARDARDAAEDSGAPDATALCGNAVCQPVIGEDCATCATDCGDCPFCGDRTCGPSEDCANCPGDCCQPCCDCASCCCDCWCESEIGEDCQSCAWDCGVCRCGNGTCDPGETCESCALDCGPC